MYSPDDTIVAPATPPGRGGVAVVRLSGPRSREVAAALIEGERALQPRFATLVRVRGRSSGLTPSGIVDEAIATFFPAGSSYTGEDVVEISVHGSPVVVAEVVEAATQAGARLARHGEFTLRAFLNGRLDLTRAEAVKDLVESTTATQARAAYDQLTGTLAERIGAIERDLFDVIARLEASGDFPEEGYHFISPEETRAAVAGILGRVEALLADGRRGRLIREGVSVAIVGRPNVGKSTLFNRLAGAERAIVTAVPGTTRDVLTESVMLLGTRILLADTAGIRESHDAVEREGVERAKLTSRAADATVVVIDGSEALQEDDLAVLAATEDRPRVIAINKADLWEDGGAEVLAPGDLPPGGSTRGGSTRGGMTPGGVTPGGLVPGAAATGPIPPGSSSKTVTIRISALTGAGVDQLVLALRDVVGLGGPGETPAVTNVRHLSLLGQTAQSLGRARNALGVLGQIPEEVVLSDLYEASRCLQEVSGKRSNEDLLEAIFSRFCIGK